MEAKQGFNHVVNRPLRLTTGRTVVWSMVAIIVVAGVWALWRHLEKQPFILRWKVVRYLKRESFSRDFRIVFPFPSKAEMDWAPKPTTVGSGVNGLAKDVDGLREEYFTLKTAALRLESALAENIPTEKKVSLEADLKAKEDALVPVVRELWEHQKTATAKTDITVQADASPLAQAQNKLSSELGRRISEAGSYSEIYKCIGQQLWVADQLLKSKRPEHRRSGVSLALNACRNALNDAENGWVAARICEAYVLPNADLATGSSKRSAFEPDNFLNECASIFRRNNETMQVVQLYQKALLLSKTSQRADLARSQLARAYEDAGDIKSAVLYLRQIQNTNDYRWINRRLPRLEAQLKNL
jgi:hypothetical protein